MASHLRHPLLGSSDALGDITYVIQDNLLIPGSPLIPPTDPKMLCHVKAHSPGTGAWDLGCLGEWEASQHWPQLSSDAVTYCQEGRQFSRGLDASWMASVCEMGWNGGLRVSIATVKHYSQKQLKDESFSSAYSLQVTRYH